MPHPPALDDAAGGGGGGGGGGGAVLLWEVFHCRCPYSELGKNQMAVAKEIRARDVRPKVGEAVAPAVRALIAACWDRDPARRPPSFADVVCALDAARDAVAGL